MGGGWTHDDTVLLVGLHPDCSDVADIYAAQRAKEAGLAVLMAGQQLPVCHHQAARDTRRGRRALGDDLQGKWPKVVEEALIFVEQTPPPPPTERPYSFRDGLTQQLHPLGHVLLVVGAQLQSGSLRQDHLEGVRTLCAVRPTAAPAVLSSVIKGLFSASRFQLTIIMK